MPAVAPALEPQGSNVSAGEPTKLSCMAYIGYYLLLFFAYWFGSNRFDADGDGDFDPEDVQLFLADMGIVTRNFQKTKKPKSPGHAPSQGRAPSAGAKAGQPQAGQPKAGEQQDPGEDGEHRGSIFDQNGDGEVDLEDVIESQVHGESVEEYIRKEQRWPIFIVGESLVAVLFWIFGSITVTSRGDGTFLSNKAGIDTFSPGWSDLRLFGSECQDWRGEVWRNLTYQWTHVGVSHILMNCFLNLILGIPLEGLHGFFRMFFMYNAGVFGGAICYWIGDAHKHVVGMSGGCYALIGIHISDLLLNWNQIKFRKPIVVFLLVLVTVDVLSYVLALGESNSSHTAHLGGAGMGLAIGVLIGKNLVVKKCERVLQVCFFVVGGVWLIFCIAWMAGHNPPMSIGEAEGWCWARQVWNPSRFGHSNWVCVKCGDQACIDSFANERYIETVRLSDCTSFFYND